MFWLTHFAIIAVSLCYTNSLPIENHKSMNGITADNPWDTSDELPVPRLIRSTPQFNTHPKIQNQLNSGEVLPVDTVRILQQNSHEASWKNKTNGHPQSSGEVLVTKNTQHHTNKNSGEVPMTKNTQHHTNHNSGEIPVTKNTQLHTNQNSGEVPMTKNTQLNTNQNSGEVPMTKNTQLNTNQNSGEVPMTKNTQLNTNQNSGVVPMTKNTQLNTNQNSGEVPMTKNTQLHTNQNSGEVPMTKNTQLNTNQNSGEVPMTKNTQLLTNQNSGELSVTNGTQLHTNQNSGEVPMTKNTQLHTNQNSGEVPMTKNTQLNTNQNSGEVPMTKNTQLNTNQNSGVVPMTKNTQLNTNQNSGEVPMTKNTQLHTNQNSGEVPVTKNTQLHTNQNSGEVPVTNGTQLQTNQNSGEVPMTKGTQLNTNQNSGEVLFHQQNSGERFMKNQSHILDQHQHQNSGEVNPKRFDAAHDSGELTAKNAINWPHNSNEQVVEQTTVNVTTTAVDSALNSHSEEFHPENTFWDYFNWITRFFGRHKRSATRGFRPTAAFRTKGSSKRRLPAGALLRDIPAAIYGEYERGVEQGSRKLRRPMFGGRIPHFAYQAHLDHMNEEVGPLFQEIFNNYPLLGNVFRIYGGSSGSREMDEGHTNIQVNIEKSRPEQPRKTKPTTKPRK